MKFKTLLFVAALFLIFRFALVLTHVEKTSEAEELYRGTIAQEVLAGPRHPVLDYQADNYSGGSLAIGFLAAPYFKFLGSNLFALKLAPFTVSFGAFLLLLFFMGKYFGEKAALNSALLVIFCPPAFSQIAFAAMGYHSESVIFSVAILILCQRFLEDPSVSGQGLKLFLWGALSGLGFWFTHITLITVLTSVAVWCWVDFTSLRRNWKWFAVGFLSGIVPWIVYNLTHELNGIRFIVKNLFGYSSTNDEPEPSHFIKFFRLIFCEIPFSFVFPDVWRIPGNFLNYAYFLCSALALSGGFSEISRRVFSRPRDPMGRALVLLLFFPVIYLFIYTLSGVDLQGGWWPEQNSFDSARYLIPFQFFFFMLLGTAVFFSPKSRPWLGALILLGFTGQSTLLFKEPLGRALRYQGTSYRFLGSVEGQTWPRQFSSFAEYVKSVSHLPGARRFYLLTGASSGMQFEKNFSPAMAKAVLESTLEENRNAMIQGIGYAAGAQRGPKSLEGADFLPLFSNIEEEGFFYRGVMDGALSDDGYTIQDYFSEYIKYAQGLSVDNRKWVYYSLGFVAAFAPPIAERAESLIRDPQINDTDLEWFYRGAGARAASSWINENLTFHEAAEGNMPLKIPERWQDEFYFGVGWGLRQVWLEDGVRARDWAGRAIGSTPVLWRGKVLEGLEAYENYFRLPQ